MALSQSVNCVSPNILSAYVDSLCFQDEYFESLKQSARKEMAEAEVNAALRVQFQHGSDVIRDVCFVFGGLSDSLVTLKSGEAVVGR